MGKQVKDSKAGMPFVKVGVGAIVLLVSIPVIVALALTAGCQYELSEADAERMVAAMMTNATYLEFLEDADGKVATAVTKAMLEHPSFQTTPEEDCAGLIVMAAVMSENYSLPNHTDTERLCDWYADNFE